MSSRLLNTIRSFYSAATACVSLPHGATPSIPIRNGVLQGDTLSPLLFSLFMHDIDDYFRATLPNLQGVSLSHATDINCLLYADDLVLLATSPVQLTLLLRGLSSYTELNDLVINTEKWSFSAKVAASPSAHTSSWTARNCRS